MSLRTCGRRALKCIKQMKNVKFTEHYNHNYLRLVHTSIVRYLNKKWMGKNYESVFFQLSGWLFSCFTCFTCFDRFTRRANEYLLTLRVQFTAGVCLMYSYFMCRVKQLPWSREMLMMIKLSGLNYGTLFKCKLQDNYIITGFTRNYVLISKN